MTKKENTTKPQVHIMGKSTGFESIMYFQAPEGSQPFSGLFEPQKQAIIRAKDLKNLTA